MLVFKTKEINYNSFVRVYKYGGYDVTRVWCVRIGISTWQSRTVNMFCFICKFCNFRYFASLWMDRVIAWGRNCSNGPESVAQTCRHKSQTGVKDNVFSMGNGKSFRIK